ncbi:pyridoxamine 5'-phosphate oxidase family protein [Aquimarina sp. AD1]|uniref:pyridoxamine 5'-phosphate oxidase family protein n=1 Tax=Aquimarina sp. (strain AD1) TaxID=1714848 RepID=UPI000E4ACFA7|nr:pyridoxamine 5'-phosphate oxidase family protein [Aquimarina sp. AD1]AXT55008.1 pyridoxamine 5'-phosphate oxidase family protein [Aquimarina sp. AD1]RKN19524.1 pyridoxamine 5'-phosphate oxidase family protein [Aquimarina sp. AD1]
MSEYKVTPLNKVIRGAKRATYDKMEINKILDDTFLCHVGYVWNNQAIVIPTAYGREGDTIYIHGSLKNRMIVNLLEEGKASISVTHLDGLILARSAFHHSANYRSVTVFGNVRKVEDPKEKMSALECILNHMVPGHWNNIRKPNTKEFNATLVMAIKIDTASAKVRAEGVVDEKEDHNLPIWAGVVPIKQVAYEPISESNLNPEIKIPNAVSQYVNDNS